MSIDALDRSLAAVGDLIEQIAPDQWSLPTPCTDWDVSRVVQHLVGMNLVFAAMLEGTPPPQRGPVPPAAELPPAYRSSAAALLAAFGADGVLERSFQSPMGAATGQERLLIRLYDLLAHGWDLARAIGAPAALPEDAAELALEFARTQVRDADRPGRFEPAQQAPEGASELDRLAAFLGRTP